MRRCAFLIPTRIACQAPGVAFVAVDPAAAVMIDSARCGLFLAAGAFRLTAAAVGLPALRR